MKQHQWLRRASGPLLYLESSGGSGFRAEGGGVSGSK